VNPPEYEHVVYASFYGSAIVTKEGWKLRTFLNLNKCISYAGFGASLDSYNCTTDIIYQLYNIFEDYEERINLAEKYPDKVRELPGKLLKE